MSDPHFLRRGHAPTPFTAEEIRMGCPEGRTVTTVTTGPDGDTTGVSRFASCREDGATFINDGGAFRVSWRDLQSHASFPDEITTVTRDTIETPLGTLDCLHYEVADEAETHHFWFELSRPGMPVLYTTEVGGEIVSTTTMISDVVV